MLYDIVVKGHREMCLGIKHLSQSIMLSLFFFGALMPSDGVKEFNDCARDIFSLHKNLFRKQSIEVLSVALPAYLIGRSLDERLQKDFYDATKHAGCNQVSKTVYRLSDIGGGSLIYTMSLGFMMSGNNRYFQTGRMLLIGALSLTLTKMMLKEIRSYNNLRPWHENYSCTIRSYGGLPSGHAAQMAFSAAFLGLRHGIKIGLPLSLLTAFTAMVSINRNEHYLSQTIAGTAYGILYAYAANTTLLQKAAKHDLSIHISPHKKGLKASVNYRF
jgi:hypothetical protein